MLCCPRQAPVPASGVITSVTAHCGDFEARTLDLLNRARWFDVSLARQSWSISRDSRATNAHMAGGFRNSFSSFSISALAANPAVDARP